MSKIDFSKNMSDTLSKKIKAFLSGDYTNFFEYDEYFELALCLSYMTLSKEKIIKKDIENKDRLRRLNSLVDSAEISKLFSTDFCDEIPVIDYSQTKESDYVWILDNIRDCIMHGAFDVDEENKKFLINNTQYDRDIKAEIPFSWFIQYTKGDILTKKQVSHWTMKGFFYNKERTEEKFFKTKTEVYNNIMYEINITGNPKFNVDAVEEIILHAFEVAGKLDFSDAITQRFKDKFPHRGKYSDRYLAAFALAAEYVKETIEKKFPGTSVKVSLNDKKYQLAEKVDKRIAKSYQNYDILIKELNHSISRKSYELLACIQMLLETSGSSGKDEFLEKLSNPEFDTIFQFVMKFDGELKKDLKYGDLVKRYNSVGELFLNILINVYGLTTLVVNHGEIYNDEILKAHPLNFGIRALVKQPIIDYEKSRLNSLEQMLNTEIKLFELKQEYAANPSKNKMKNIKKVEIKLMEKKDKFNMSPVQSIKTKAYSTNSEPLSILFDKYMKDFYSCTDKNTKEVVRDIILDVYKSIAENEVECSNAVVDNMRDALTIIRNCFSHIGRIQMGKYKGLETTVILHDYDNNNMESGVIFTTLGTLMDVLRKPFDELENEKKYVKELLIEKQENAS